jgi:hypothetical protein
VPCEAEQDSAVPPENGGRPDCYGGIAVVLGSEGLHD